MAISFALPTYAQQTDVADPQTTQSFFTSFKDYEKAFNNHDAVALTNYYTQDAVTVTPDGLISGRDTIQKWWAGHFQSHPKDFTGPLDGNVLHVIGMDGNQLWATGTWSETIQGKNGEPIALKGRWLDLYVREGDNWKVRVDAYNLTNDSVINIVKSFGTPSPTASPSTQ